MNTDTATKSQLSAEQLRIVEELKEKLPSNWATLFLQDAEKVLRRRYTRQTAYQVLNEAKTHHDGWKILEAIARKHQEALAAL